LRIKLKKNQKDKEIYIQIYKDSLSSHFKQLKSFESAFLFSQYLRNKVIDNLSFQSIIERLWGAEKPFQFLAQIYGIYHMSPDLYNRSGISEIQDDNEIVKYFNDMVIKTPITQDASASAYQIMSWLLLNTDIAEKTNIIPSAMNQKEDIYEFFLNEL